MANESPFKNLKEFDAGTYAYIRQAKDDPSLLVKEFGRLQGETDEEPVDPNYTFEDFSKKVVKPLQRVKEYGLGKFLPPTEPIWAKNNYGQQLGYLI